MRVPEHLQYTEEHEWVETIDERTIRVGITDYAQDALGDVVFVQLPTVGTAIEHHGLLAEVESTKSVAEVYAPISGTVIKVNNDLVTRPELINQDPYAGGWFCEIELPEATILVGLLDAGAYRSLTE
ncbi:MAG: glycine cleavage system protein GcvH [Actinomycetota bacterium]